MQGDQAQQWSLGSRIQSKVFRLNYGRWVAEYEARCSGWSCITLCECLEMHIAHTCSWMGQWAAVCAAWCSGGGPAKTTFQIPLAAVSYTQECHTFLLLCIWRMTLCCKALCDVKFRQIEGNGRKCRHIELSNFFCIFVNMLMLTHPWGRSCCCCWCCCWVFLTAAWSSRGSHQRGSHQWLSVGLGGWQLPGQGSRLDR